MILRFLLSFTIVLFGCLSSLSAQMRITEYMYSGTGGEFIEFTNTGGSTIDMTNWSYDDNSQAPDVFDLTGFGMVAPGESVIITEDDAAIFRIAWGLDASVKVLGGVSNNLGRNDEINLYDASDMLVDQLTYGDEDFPGSIRTKDESGWTEPTNLGANTIATWVLSFVGDSEGSYTSSNGDIGSPGTYGGSTSPPALYISEILFNPPGSDSPNEYIEIRGPANLTIPSGIYLVGIEGDGSAGDVQTIFALSGFNLGSNGYLVIRQIGNSYTIDAGGGAVTPGSDSGFSGLFQFAADSGGDIENTSVSFLLIAAPDAPSLSDDIDSNNDGTPDGAVFPTWTILDGISCLDGGSSDCGYADLVLSKDNDGLYPAGATFHNLGFEPEYVARNGESTGNTLADWVIAENLAGTAPNWLLPSGTTSPVSLEGRALDHIGSFNFPVIVSMADQLAIWTFDDLDDVCSGTELAPTVEDARGIPYLQQFFQEIDDNGKGGTPYTDVEGVMHPDGKAITWDDIKGSGDDAELWITLSTIDWTDISIRFDYRIDDDGSDDSYDLEYSTDGGFSWTKPANNQTLIDDDSYHSESIDLTTEDALENQACVIFRFSDFDNDGNNEFRFDNIEITGTKTAPDANAPFIQVNTAATTALLDLNEAGGGFVSGVINDPTDPAATSGIDFTLTDANTPESSLTVTASSSDQSVVTDANLVISGSGDSRNLTITPTGVGYTDIRVEVRDGTFTDYYLIKYAASAQLPSLSYCHTGVSDASTAIAVDANYMLVADDENEIIRLYDRNNSGLPLNTFDFTKELDLDGKPREVDIEASVQVDNRIYWLGSHSNNSSGEERPNRSRLFATDISGAGASTDLSFEDFYEYLKDDLVAWDAANGHGLGANFLGLAASTADGVVPEAADGFNIEGLDMAPGSTTTAYVAFRAPIEPASNRTKALIVPVTNFTTLLGASSGSATFGTPIQLDLGGRGIRSLGSNNNDEYIIVAGPAGSSGSAPNDFQLYYWDGMPASTPVMIDANPLFDQGVSFESIVELPTPLNNGDIIQMLADNGDTNWYGDGERSKDLPQTNFQKFCSGQFTLDLCAIDATPPVAMCQNLTIQLDAAGDASIFASSVDNGSMDECGIDARSLDQSSFTCADVGPNTVTLTVMDLNGNTATCSATITVEDSTAPTAICKNTTVEIQADGMYILMESDVFDDINSSDNCEISNVSFTTTTFTCDDIDLTFPIMVTVTDPSGNSDDCTANVLVALGDALPDGWSSTDIGSVTIGNDYSFDPCTAPNPEDGEFTIIGSGNNAFSTTTDNVAFASQSICGDGSITAKIESISPNGYGGLMIRETNDANSKQVAIFSNLTNILRHETRYLLGANKVVQAFNRPGPVWLKLERQGNWFFAYYSTTGSNFQYVHAVYAPMNSCVEIGLASFTYQINQQTEAVFSHVDVQGGNSMMPGPITDHQSQIINTLTVYPNPAQHFFKLQLEQPIEHTSTVQLLSPLGQLIESKVIHAGAITLEWPVYNLPAGMYLLKLELDGVQTEMKQLMVVR